MDASTIIDQKIASLNDWRGSKLETIRKLIHQVAPAVVEEWKWMGTPVWNVDGIICLANAHSKVVKVTFPKGAKLADPKGVFNAGLGGSAWRAIDLPEGSTLDAEGFKGLVRAAIALNGSSPAARKPDAASSVSAKRSGATSPPAKKAAKKAPSAKKTAKTAAAISSAPKKAAAKKAVARK